MGRGLGGGGGECIETMFCVENVENYFKLKLLKQDL